MRHSTFVRVSVLSLSVGLVGLVPTRASAQASERVLQPAEGAAPWTLSRRVEIDLTRSATTAGPALPKFKLSPFPGNPRIKLESIGDPSFGPPVDYKMPVIKADPSIDPRIIKPLQEDGVKHR